MLLITVRGAGFAGESERNVAQCDVRLWQRRWRVDTNVCEIPESPTSALDPSPTSALDPGP